MKSTQEIYEAMLETVAERAGFDMDDSCDLAVRLYAAAAQLESLYAYADWSRKQCFPDTASGEYLDMHAEMHGLTREPAEYAAGVLSLSLGQALGFDLTIPAGTCFCVPGGLSYCLTQDCTIPAGVRLAGMDAQCTEPGVEGNCAAGEICGMVDAPPYIVSVTNEAAFTGGRAAESDEHLRLRVLRALRRRPNGANAAYYEALALSVPGITSAVAVANYPSEGGVGLCVSGNYGSPTDAQLSAVRAALADRTELGVSLSVVRPTVLELDIELTVWPVDGATGEEAVAAAQAAVEEYFAKPMLREGFYRSALGSRIYQTGLVKNYAFTSPTQDSVGSLMRLITLGDLTVEAGE